MSAQSKKCPRNDKRGLALSLPKGFTLVELLVVIAIISILSVIGITIFNGAQKSARDAIRKSDIRAIVAALEEYKLVNGDYPLQGSPTYRGWGASDLPTPTTTNYILNLASSFADGKLPVDPLNNSTYHYMYHYYIASELETRPTWQCDGLTQYYVVGAVQMEKDSAVGSCWRCGSSGRNWCVPGEEFGGGFALGNYR